MQLFKARNILYVLIIIYLDIASKNNLMLKSFYTGFYFQRDLSSHILCKV